MSASIRLLVIDLDGDEPEVTYIIDNLDDWQDAVDTAIAIAETNYIQTGILPRLPDGTPFDRREE